MRTYTVHELAGAPADGKGIVFVREGFSWAAVVFSLFWLLFHRLWIVAAFYFALTVAMMMGAQAVGLSEAVASVLSIILQGFLGAAAHDLQRWTLARNGYREIGIAAGSSLADAERDFFRHWQGSIAAAKPTPPRPLSAPVWPHKEEPDAHGALGLFPHVGM